MAGYAVRLLQSRCGLLWIAALALLNVTSATATATATAAAVVGPTELWKEPPSGLQGSGGGQLRSPAAVAADPTSGLVYVADEENGRVSVFTAFGEFTQTFGWGVVASGPDDQPRNELQRLTVDATGGFFGIAYRPNFGSKEDAGPIAFNASAAAVQAKLESLTEIGPGSVLVTGPSGGPWTIEFVGPAADEDFGLLQTVSTDSGGVPTLTGGTQSAISETLQTGANLETCVPSNGDVCQAGQRTGSEPGQFMFGGDASIAMDGNHNIYVSEGSRLGVGGGGGPSENNYRVQKLSPSGDFLWTVGGEVNKTKSGEPGASSSEENLCTIVQVEAGDQCGSGSTGSGNGQFEAVTDAQLSEISGGRSRGITVVPGGSIAVGDLGRIQLFAPSGVFEGSVSLSGLLSGRPIQSLVSDPAGNFWLRSTVQGKVFNLAPNGAEVTSPVAVEGPAALATDSKGNLYVASVNETVRFEVVDGTLEELVPGSVREIVEFDSAGLALLPMGEGFARSRSKFGSGGVFLKGLVTNVVSTSGGSDVYVTAGNVSERFVSAYGPAPDKWAPPVAPPEILSQYAVSLKSDSATLGAQINPRFWADTTYSVEYGLGNCSTPGGCPNVLPVTPATLSGEVTGLPVNSAGVEIPGLAPNTTYYYRFIAQSTGSAGQPVRGVGGTVGTDGTEAAFTTPPPPPAPPQACGNDAFRFGQGAKLRDCRAYEMVSPVEKNNIDIKGLPNFDGNLSQLNQASVDGESITYTTSQGFGDAQGVPYVSQYIASRGGGGWSNHAITPRQGVSTQEIGQRLEVEFRAFSPDLCSGALVNKADPPLAIGGIKGFANLYRRQNCGPETFETLSTIEPPSGAQPASFVPEPQQISANGSCVTFYYPIPTQPLYESCGGLPHLVSVLPTGILSPAGGSAGSRNGSGSVRTANSLRAISADGSRVYWTTQTSPPLLYLRLNPDQPQSAIVGGACAEADKACTLEVPNKGEATHFWSATPDGSKAILTLGQLGGSLELAEYSLATKKTTAITTEVLGVLGASEDASKVSFVSRRALGPGPNAEGKSPTAGQPNLYLLDAARSGTARFRFIGTVTAADTQVEPANNFAAAAAQPYKHLSRLSPDGQTVAFMSGASLTGYENIDSGSGKVDLEVFRYDAAANSGAGELSCVSCDPTGARPTGRPLQLEQSQTDTWAAALIAPFETELHAPRVISDDGKRVFFDSYGALVGADTNGKADAYQWEAPGTGECTTASGAYSSPNEGCLSLISSGQSPVDSTFVDSSPSGRDAFFSTAESLLPQDTGLYDIYDAREGGGYPRVATPPAPCVGETCQAGQAPPAEPTRSTITPTARNPRSPKPNCGKGRHAVKKKGKWRCVSNKAKHGKKSGKKSKGAKKKAGKSGGAGR